MGRRRKPPARRLQRLVRLSPGEVEYRGLVQDGAA